MIEKSLKMSTFYGSYRRVAEATSGYAEWRYFSLLIFLLSVMFLGNISYLDLTGGDETRVAGISRMMLETGDYFMPRLNGVEFLEYPPLFYRLQCFSFELFGFNAFAAKLPSALAGIVGACLLYFLVRSMKYSALTAFFSALIMGSSAQYYGNGLTATVDSLLAMFAIMAWCGFYAWGVKEQKDRRCRSFLVLVIGLSGGMMTKNLPGVAVPLSGIVLFMIIDDIIKKKFNVDRFFMLSFAVLLSLIIPACYGWFLYDEYGLEAVKTMFWYNNFGRFLGENSDHSEPFYYYLSKLHSLFQPWLLFLFIALVFHIKRVIKKHTVNSLYALAILAMPLLMLTISSAKRQVYLLALAAPCAILVGTMFGMFVEGKIVRFSAQVDDMIIKVSFYVIFVLGLLVPITFVITGIALGMDGWWRYWAAVVMILLTFRVWRLAKPRHEEKLLVYMALIFALIYPNISGIALAYSHGKESFKSMFLEAESRGGKLYLLSREKEDTPRENLSGAGCFYFGRNLPIARTLDDVKPGETVIGTKFLSPDKWDAKVFCEKYYMGTRK